MDDARSESPSIDLARARRAAKALKKALAVGDPAAVARLFSVFGESRRAPAGATHADCLHVIAREQGAESWPRLKFAVEAAAMTRAERRSALGRALFQGSFHRVDRLLRLDPALPAGSLPLLLALAREDAALGLLKRDPAAATRPVAGRPPIAHLCFSRIAQRDPSAPERQVRLLDALLAAGADANDGAPVEGEPDHRLSPLYGAIGHASNLPLAEALLARGADPNDNESLYHASEIEQEAAALVALRLLFAHGAQVGSTNAFLRMLDRECPEGVRLFLANGADPNVPPYRHPSDAPAEARNALHHAILRGRSGAIGALLIDAGVDTAMRHDGKSPYALSCVCGNAAMAALLAARGLATDLSPAETFLARLAEGDAAGARAILSDHPDLWCSVTERDRTRQTELAMRREALPTLRTMAALGFDIDLPGEGGMPPVHAAAWWGHAETVAMYVGLGARLDSVNEFGGDALGTAIHGSANCPGRREGDYERTVRALLDGGAAIRPEAGHLEMGSEAVTLTLEVEVAARPGK